MKEYPEKDNEYIELNVVSFDIPNNMYNINSLNNTLQVNGMNKYIPNGNYTFKTILLTLLPTGTVTTYNDTQNTYTFTGTGTMKPITMGNLIGLTNNIQVSINNLTTGLINLSEYSKVILRTQNEDRYRTIQNDFI